MHNSCSRRVVHRSIERQYSECQRMVRDYRALLMFRGDEGRGEMWFGQAPTLYAGGR
jgi:hypothetical protein